MKHKLYDLRTQGKLTSRLCPGKVYVWLKVNKHYQPSFDMNCVKPTNLRLPESLASTEVNQTMPPEVYIKF
ncbi:MAG: hypothetical protein ACTS6A_00305 [Candidatus Hodgkinia cicadicola]